MANQIRTQQLFHYLSFHINKTQALGHGSYGAVYKAKCDQLPCGTKLLHPMKRYRAKPSVQLPKHMHILHCCYKLVDNHLEIVPVCELKAVKAMGITVLLDLYDPE